MIHVSFHTHGHIRTEASQLGDGSYALSVLNPDEGELTLFFDTPKAFDQFCGSIAMDHRRQTELPPVEAETGTLTTDPAYDPFIEPAVQQASA